MGRSALAAGLWVLILTVGGCTGEDAPAPDEADAYPLTPAQALRAATAAGDLDLVRAALAAGADVDDDAMQTTALHIAVETGDVAMVRLLVDAGADVDALHRESYRPLHLASAAGDVEVMRALLIAGADPAAEVVGGIDDGATALHLAAGRGRLDAMDVLVRAGADIGSRDRSGFSLLLTAACEGQLEAVRLLIGWGADRVSQDTQWAIDCAIEQSHPDVADYLRTEASPAE